MDKEERDVPQVYYRAVNLPWEMVRLCSVAGRDLNPCGGYNLGLGTNATAPRHKKPLEAGALKAQE